MSQMPDTPDLPTYVLTERTHLRLPSKPHWIEATVEWLRQKAILSGACQESRAGKLLVALHEAISNAIVHGNLELSSALKERSDDSFARALAERGADPRLAARVVDVHIECDADRCRWIVTDEGPGFDVEAVLRRHDSDDPEVLLASGRGILIMKSFLDEVRWELGGRRLILGLARTNGEEKRQELRVPRQQPVRVAPIRPDGTVDWAAAHEAVARNWSEHGIGLLQERLAQTERILIGMAVNDQMIYVPAEVRHCRSGSGDIVELGCRFQTAPAAASPAAPETAPAPAAGLHEAITTLLEQHAEPRTEDERRRHQRVAYTERIEVVTKLAAPVAGYARDLSKGGMAFIVHAPLPEEITIVLRPRDGGEPLKIRARVARCNKIIEGFYDVGAEFLQLEHESHG
ncbi:MAG: PilZ domain-containing protein [Gemmataceae bacterium]|nr:PilZ domain-containing protein [Gemmataceae bacterium]